jgi:hypothetical protein
MIRTSKTVCLMSLALAVQLAACQSDDLNDLRPELIISPGNPTDSAEHYVLDFGNVDIGSTKSLSITINDQSLVKLTLQPADVTAPFGTVITDVQTISPHDTYKPTEAGPSMTSVTLVSDSVDAGVLNRIVDLKGTGVVPAPPVCTFTVAPTSVDFGSVMEGQSKTSGVHVTNTGTASCPLTAAIAPTSSTAFTLAAGQPAMTSVAIGATVPIGVTFTPLTSSGTFAGTLDLTIAGTAMHVPLSGTSPAPPAPCTWSVDPMNISFGFVSVGMTKTSGVTVKNTGSSTACSISNVAIGSGSATAFTLASGQATTGALAAGASMAINVTFDPMTANDSYDGTLTFLVGTATVTVPLNGATPGGCPNPNANGSCGSATAPVYVNSDTTLYTFDPATHAVTFVANFTGTLDAIWDIAIQVECCSAAVPPARSTLSMWEPVRAPLSAPTTSAPTR